MTITVFTKKQVIEAIQAKVDKYRSQAEAARALGVTAPVLSTVLSGMTPPPPKLCKAVGVERVKLYARGVEARHRD